ncbi:MAG: hypothetical protein JSW26_17515 [Desulfobacterales bacterium]|nr:MAG: hypothetical protein JSW26_17515 [Desulfobacterales bacterium]
MDATPNKDDRPIRMWSFFKPALQGGEYKISVEQMLQLSDADIKALQQKLYIDAPRFALDPRDIHSLYPARDAAGSFAGELPHIVFTKRTLPWERPISATATAMPEDNPPPVPWLALVVFVEGEVSETFTTTIKDYLQTDNPKTKIPLRGQISSATEQFINNQQHCQYIEVALEVFQALMPRLNELPLLAHVREVDMDYKADVDMPSRGVFSIVMANRLPLPGRNHIVHLVSIEGCEDLLDHQENKGATDTEIVRLISLVSWSFKCSAGLGSFREMVGRLSEQDPEDLRLALPAGDEMEANARQRLKSGYVPLPYHFMSGENSFAWYRGPAIPAPHDRTVMQPPDEALFSASAAMRFDRTTGAFDQTYAAAWQLGRSLALADPQFGPRLMGLRRKAHQVWDKFCDIMFFVGSDKLTVEIDELVPLARKLAEGEVDMQAVDKFLENALKGLIGRIDVAVEKMTGGSYDTLQVSDLLQMDFDKDRADAFQNDTRSGLFDLIFKVVERVLIPLRERLGAGLLGSLKDQLDLLSGIYKLALSKLIDRMADKVLKPQLVHELEAVYQWMDNLSLTDIPFNYLVAHPDLLPPESLRFFYVDEFWWYALFDGAASLGLHSSIDEALYQVMRKRFLGRWIEKNFKSRRHQWGLILRSSLVGMWSGIEFYVYEEKKLIRPLITRKLGEDLILFLFEHVPDSLELREPKEGLRFGVDEVSYPTPSEDGKSGPFAMATVSEKYAFGSNQAGKSTGKAITLMFRQNGARWQNVLDIAETVKKRPIAGSAEFALQLIKKPERLILEAPKNVNRK